MQGDGYAMDTKWLNIKPESKNVSEMRHDPIAFNKAMKKWHAQIMIAGKSLFIGYYDNEEAAAVDYARAVFRYKGQGALDKARERRGLFPDIQV